MKMQKQSLPLIDAKADYLFLLNRGYSRSSALAFVGDFYRLSRRERNILFRTVFSDREVVEHKSKIIPLRNIYGREVVVDGFNVLITVEALLSGDGVLECMDGFHRDASGVYGKYRFGSRTTNAVDAIFSVLLKHKPSFVLWVFDSQISMSGELAAYVKRKMGKYGMTGDAVTKKAADSEIKRLKKVTFTSDTVLIERLSGVVDIIPAIRKTGWKSL